MPAMHRLTVLAEQCRGALLEDNNWAVCAAVAGHDHPHVTMSGATWPLEAIERS